jgi:hypothetical protein
MSRAENHPQSRRDEFVVQELESGEVIAYHRDTHETHCLNPIAAQVWIAADGRTSPSQISSGLSLGANEADPADLTHRALTQLTAAGLVEWVERDSGMSRRDALVHAGAGLAAAVTVPLVLSIVAPTPAEALTCLASGASCTSDGQCCSGRCVGGFCV